MEAGSHKVCESSFRLEANPSENGDRLLSVCATCNSYSFDRAVFHNFGDISEYIKALPNYAYYRKLAFGTLVCSTFNPKGFSFVHSRSRISYAVRPDRKEGY